jgi:hypothetical protein
VFGGINLVSSGGVGGWGLACSGELGGLEI